MADAALEIADPIERLQHLLAQFGRLAQDRLAHIGGGVTKAGEIVVAVDLEYVIEQEADVFEGSFVDRHDDLSAGWRTSFRGDFAAQQLFISRIELKAASDQPRAPVASALTGAPRGRGPIGHSMLSPGNFPMG